MKMISQVAVATVLAGSVLLGTGSASFAQTGAKTPAQTPSQSTGSGKDTGMEVPSGITGSTPGASAGAPVSLPAGSGKSGSAHHKKTMRHSKKHS